MSGEQRFGGNQSVELAVALTVYNRTYHLRQVLAALRNCCGEIEILYVFCDGPKSSQDLGAVGRVREIVKDITWIPRIMVERARNLGLAKSLVSAVDYVFERHASIILLEDDCVPGPHFFRFMKECLDLYRGDKRVLSISGYTVPIPQILRDNHPYDLYFFPRFGSWGWATWKDRWDFYERDFAGAYERACRTGVNFDRAGGDIEGIIQRTIQGGLDAWTPGWLLGGLMRDLYTIYPMVSHIQNIGHDGSGVHCGRSPLYDTPVAKDFSPRFPPSVFLNRRIDNHFRKYYG